MGSENENVKTQEDWDGVEQREVRRRYVVDRRASERRKKYWWAVLFPIIVGVCITALISWGAYVTHVTYTISANYEMSFKQHIQDRVIKDASLEHTIELMRSDYTHKLTGIRQDMDAGLKEIRDTNLKIYNLLLEKESRK